MKNDEHLAQISEFCRNADMAESTFGLRSASLSFAVKQMCRDSSAEAVQRRREMTFAGHHA
jgi:hypothetical protein